MIALVFFFGDEFGVQRSWPSTKLVCHLPSRKLVMKVIRRVLFVRGLLQFCFHSNERQRDALCHYAMLTVSRGHKIVDSVPAKIGILAKQKTYGSNS